MLVKLILNGSKIKKTGLTSVLEDGADSAGAAAIILANNEVDDEDEE
jgi:hypothetical protein